MAPGSIAVGEPRGRWWGAGAAALGLAPGSEIDRKDYGLVYAERLDPRDGVTRLGRSPRKAAGRAMARYQELLEAEPGATRARQWELQKQAARDAYCGPLYMELTAEMSKSITVFYTSVAASARSARDSGDEDEAAFRYGLLAELDEMIYEANEPRWTTSSRRRATPGRAITGGASTARRAGISTRPGW